MNPAVFLFDAWKRAGSSRFKRWRVLRQLWGLIPYTSTVRPEVVILESGKVELMMRDRPGLRNHLNSVHAAALMNFAELASGLVFNQQLPGDHRAIVTQFVMHYYHKARGTLRAIATYTPQPLHDGAEILVAADIVDASGRCVARGEATWRVQKKRDT